MSAALTAVLIPSPAPRSPYAFDWQADVCRGAKDGALDTVTGQAATFARASMSFSIDSNGLPISIGYDRPRFEWGALDFADGVESVGVRLNGDALSFPFLLAPETMTVYLRFCRHTAAGAGAVVLAIGTTSGARLVITEDVSGAYRVTYTDGTTSVFSTTARPTYDGDAVELRVVLAPSGVTLFQSIFGDDEEQGAASGALTLVPAWSASTLYLGAHTAAVNPCHSVFVRVVVALGVVAIGAFRPALRMLAALNVALVIRQVSPNIYEFSDTGVADLELADITGTGVYETIPAGTSLAAPRIHARQLAIATTLVY